MAEDFKQKAFDLAVLLGCEIYSPEGGSTYWRHGMRSSADQYCKRFNDRFEASVHFLSTKEARNALNRLFKEYGLLMEECEGREKV